MCRSTSFIEVKLSRIEPGRLEHFIKSLLYIKTSHLMASVRKEEEETGLSRTHSQWETTNMMSSHWAHLLKVTSPPSSTTSGTKPLIDRLCSYFLWLATLSSGKRKETQEYMEAQGSKKSRSYKTHKHLSEAMEAISNADGEGGTLWCSCLQAVHGVPRRQLRWAIWGWYGWLWVTWVPVSSVQLNHWFNKLQG